MLLSRHYEVKKLIRFLKNVGIFEEIYKNNKKADEISITLVMP